MYSDWLRSLFGIFEAWLTNTEAFAQLLSMPINWLGAEHSLSYWLRFGWLTDIGSGFFTAIGQTFSDLWAWLSSLVG